jgi:hypothetical protein
MGGLEGLRPSKKQLLRLWWGDKVAHRVRGVEELAMPHLIVNGARLYYEEHGAGQETVIFAHGLLRSAAYPCAHSSLAARDHSGRRAYFHSRRTGGGECRHFGISLET